ncbi:MAG: carbon storage regulator CsrA [Deltaproteobacteria bacterium]|jgi:carbon storage regulator|nr:carbon storage regulator CsrA [Deltaproteobacteria bacterium]
MLILTRKIGECIIIGDDIKVHVVDIRGKQVRLGIEAPTHAPIYRQEVYQKILEENRSAARLNPADFDQMINGRE